MTHEELTSSLTKAFIKEGYTAIDAQHVSSPLINNTFYVSIDVGKLVENMLDAVPTEIKSNGMDR